MIGLAIRPVVQSSELTLNIVVVGQQHPALVIVKAHSHGVKKVVVIPGLGRIPLELLKIRHTLSDKEVSERRDDWNWEYGMQLDTIQDAEQIRDHLLRAIYGNFYNAKQNPANSNLSFAFLPYIAGKRESRRLMGDYIVTQPDITNGVYFEDAVGTATWGIDLHYPTATSYLSTYTATAVSRWYYPFRNLYSRTVSNLLMAGRCISVSHVGLGSPRVQNTTGQMGVAVGFAAAMCKQYGLEPRELYRNADRMLELRAVGQVHDRGWRRRGQSQGLRRPVRGMPAEVPLKRRVAV